MKICLVTILYCCICLITKAQDSTYQEQLMLNGYLKGLAAYQVDKISNDGFSSQLIHNRINLKWKPIHPFNLITEIRNRLFFGEQMQRIPNFSERLRNPNEYFNLQKSWVNNEHLIVHTNIERLYADFKKDKWSMRLGRQRVNWGIGTTWNPNDLFNAYNFLDIDYEERPGSDAARLSINTASNSNLEFVYSPTNHSTSIAAAKFGLNKWDYDFQFIVGKYKGSITLGTGWAGSINDVGFKGELQYYIKHVNETDQLNMLVDIDYMFSNGWYASIGALYNSNGINHAVKDLQALNLNLSAKNLMPTMYNYILRIKKELSPITAVGGNIIYAPRVNMIILMPSFNYNISNSLDADIFIQSFYLKSESRIKSMTDYGILRLRFSF